MDELFVSTADSAAAQGHLTGRHHLAFQAGDRAMVEAFHERRARRSAAPTMARRASGPIIRAIMPRS